jgi:phosphopentomutase
MDATLKEVLADNREKRTSLVLTNLVDFDMLWGHRRDVNSYAEGLKEFDAFLPELLSSLKKDDILFITADHGCDPTYTKHTDHTREYVPVLIYGEQVKAGGNIGTRRTFSDIAQTITDIFGLKKMKNGKSFKKEILVGGL